MTLVRTNQTHYPKAGIGRRGMALGLDFITVWLISAPFNSGNLGIQFAQIFVFILTWLILRVLVVYNNQGQSLGRWAFDLKALAVENGQVVGKVPEFQGLLVREGLLCFEALLLSMILDSIINNFTAILLLIPLIIDCGAAFSDSLRRQALHDRLARTIIVSSDRGYSLDLKVKRLVDNWQRNVRR